MAALARCQLLNDVIHVRDGAEALDYLRCEGKFAGAMHGGPVVVLLDLKLPKVNGLEVLEQVRGDANLSSTPVVMLTSSREEQDLVRSYELGSTHSWSSRSTSRNSSTPSRAWACSGASPTSHHPIGPTVRGSAMRDGSRRSERLRILMLEDSALDAELISAQLQRAGLDFEAERLWTRNAFIEAIENRPFDVILADHVLPGFDGDAALALARERVPQTPFIFVSGTLTEELAVQALTRGARDYVVKQRLQRLPDAIRRARQEAQERTQLANAQAALNESQAQLQQVTDAVPALIAQLDKDHRYRFANKAFLDWHGFSLAELLGLLGSGCQRHFRLRARPAQPGTRTAGERTRFQVELIHRSGESRFVQMDCVPEHAADGSVAGYICLGSDVSLLKQAELALREDNQLLEQQVQARTVELRASKRRLQAIFESSFQHQVLLDLSGRVVDANDASLAAVLGDKKDVVGQRFAESVWFGTTEGISALIDRAVAAAVQGRSSLHALELELPTGRRSFDFRSVHYSIRRAWSPLWSPRPWKPPRACRLSMRCASHRKSRRSASSPAASHMISTTS